MITIKNFSFFYTRKEVLKDVSLVYEPGKIYYLLGPNGYGKSTLLRCIAGLHRPHKGSIEIDGHSPFERSVGVLQELCLVSEETYYPNLPTMKLAALYGDLYPLFDIDTFYKYLQMFKVEKKSQLSTLSFGQQKKLYLAFAFATRAKVILLDEPTTGLDIDSKMQLRKILVEFVDDNKTIIIGTHDIADMDVLVDGITVLGQQEVVFHENTHDILQKLSFDFVTDEAEANKALYNERTYRGFMTLRSNVTLTESNLNTELLYRGLLNQRQKITSLFK